MKRNVSLWQFAGFSLTALVGTLLQYLYDWSDKSVLAALVSGVNESTWEHMKLLFFPLFLFAWIQSLFFKEYPAFWCIKLGGFLTGLLLIPVLFYTYNGAIGQSPDWYNITVFFAATAAAFLAEWRLFKHNRLRCKHPWIPLSLICMLGVLFIVFTFETPRLPLFCDPLTGTYGIE